MSVQSAFDEAEAHVQRRLPARCIGAASMEGDFASPRRLKAFCGMRPSCTYIIEEPPPPRQEHIRSAKDALGPHLYPIPQR
jgi:hypothetical protein